MTRTIVAAGASILLLTTGSWNLHARQGKPDSTPMTALAERYVKTVLALGQHDKDYVDAYYGPPEWKREVEATKKTLDEIAAQAGAARSDLARLPSGSDELSRLRHQYLERQLSSLEARIRIVKGEKMTFDEESKALYDAVAPTLPGVALPEDPRYAREAIPGAGLSCRALRCVAPALRDSAREARRGLPDRHQGLPRTDAQARHAAERRELHR